LSKAGRAKEGRGNEGMERGNGEGKPERVGKGKEGRNEREVWKRKGVRLNILSRVP